MKGLAFLIAAAAVGTSGAAEALEPPVTARSSATTVPTLLLDDFASTFRFPSLSAEAGPAVFAYGATGSGNVDAGILLDGASGTLWFQSVHLPSDVASRTLRRFRSAHSQAGWARKLGRARIGASFTWSTDATRRRDYEAQNVVERTIERSETFFEAADVREAALGIGWAGAATVDIVVDLATESLRNELMVRSFRSDFNGTSLVRNQVRNHVSTGVRLGAAARVVVPLGRLRLALLGSVRDAGHEFQFSRSTQFVDEGALVQDEREDWTTRNAGSELQSGARLLSHGKGESAGWSVHAWYERIRGAWKYDLFGTSGIRYQTRRDRAILGASVRRLGPARILFLGGMSFVGTRERDRRERDFADERNLLEDMDRRDSFDSRFAWGAHRSFGALELTGSMGTRLSAVDPFAYLDIRVPF